MMIRKTLAVCLTLIVIGLCLSGCFFEPRKAAPPSGELISYLDQAFLTNTWKNIELSLINLHAQGWKQAISEDFTYEPDSFAEAEYPGVFADWDYAKESAFIENLYSNDITIVPKMTDDDFEIPDESGTVSIWRHIIYSFTIETSDGSVAKYRASAEITFRLVGSSWYIDKWVDESPENDPDNPDVLLSSMGVLRGIFGSN